jgi:hypothetical protein
MDDEGTSLQEVQSALDRFSAVLEVLAPNKSATDRDRYVFALTGVVRFLADMKAPREAQDVFAKLAMALMDLDYDIVDPVLRPKKRGKGGRRPDPLTWRFARAKLSVGIAGLIAAGKAPDEAASLVVERIGARLGCISRSSQPSARTVRDWYDVFSQALSNSDDLAECYFRTNSHKLRLAISIMREEDRLAFALAQLDQLTSSSFSG